mgnify:CR=1 FL=1
MTNLGMGSEFFGGERRAFHESHSSLRYALSRAEGTAEAQGEAHSAAALGIYRFIHHPRSDRARCFFIARCPRASALRASGLGSHHAFGMLRQHRCGPNRGLRNRVRSWTARKHPLANLVHGPNHTHF